MKVGIPVFASCGLFLAAASTSTMCVYTYPPEDYYSRSSWTSTDRPLGPFEVEELTLIFEDEGNVMLILDDSTVLHGEYDHDGTTATLTGLQTEIENITVTFIELHMNGDDTVFLLWQVQKILNPFSTALHRVGT